MIKMFNEMFKGLFKKLCSLKRKDKIEILYEYGRDVQEFYYNLYCGKEEEYDKGMQTAYADILNKMLEIGLIKYDSNGKPIAK